MADDKDLEGGAGEGNGSEGGAGGSNDDSSGKNGKGGSEGTVSRADHERALNDLKRFKSDNRKLSEDFANFKKQYEEEKAEQLRKKKDYEGLYSTESERSKQLSGEVQTLRQQLEERDRQRDQNARLNAVQTAALAMGLRQEAIEDLQALDMDDQVSVEVTSSGRILVRGHKDFAERLKASKPHWFTDPKAPGVNSGGGGAPPGKGKVTAEDCYKADRDLKLGKITPAQRDEIYKRYDEGRKRAS